MLIICIIGNFYLGGAEDVARFWIVLFWYSILAYIIYILYHFFKKTPLVFFSIENYTLFLEFFLYRAMWIILLLIGFLWSFSYYQNELSPATLPRYTISNGDKTVVFQTMSHIWSENFYTTVQNTIFSYKQKWFVLFFEWVQSGTQENNNKLDQALWMNFNETTYDSLSKLYGLVQQDNSKFLNLVNNKDYNIDISIDDIITSYEKIKKENGLENRTYSPPINTTELVTKELSELPENKLQLLKYVNRAFINVILKNESLQANIQNTFANKELFEVILTKRNEFISNAILKSQEKNIIATYWLLHFQGIFELLQASDIKWRITQIDYIYPLK